MPKVHFVQENLTVEAEAGRRLSDVAKDHGVSVCRQLLGWTGVGNYTVWVKGEAGCVSPPTLWERLLGLHGWRRLANRTRVLGDVMVWTQQGASGRLGGTRTIDAPPSPSVDPAAARHAPDAAGTAQFPYGHPSALDKGATRPEADTARRGHRSQARSRQVCQS